MMGDSRIILCIDDDLDLLEYVVSVLEEHGHKVLTASNGQEAVDLLVSLPAKLLPHLILLDYQMPIFDGYEFIQARIKFPKLVNIPVVLMTASSDLWPIMEKIDAEAYVNKPIGGDNILKLVQNFVHRREVAKISFLV